ncbi:MAG TPA: bifunctional nuclease family protein [Kofleriaceae bacterium]|nr:bifunctional nuclease family protein [Kofleriaceae bacterium]
MSVAPAPSFIAMNVSAMAVDPITGVPMVILTDELGGSVPIGIGLGEAAAIAVELDDIALERPMTHQLLAELVTAAGAHIRRIELRDTGATTFTAAVTIECARGKVVERAARPSDAFALALRLGCEVWVCASVLERIARAAAHEHTEHEHEQEPAHEHELELASAEPLQLGTLGPEAFGKWKM